MKKKILVSICLILAVGLCSFCYGFFFQKSQNKEIENPTKIIYYVDDNKTYGFELDLPDEICDKCIISESETIKDLKEYSFTQKNTGEILFIVYVSKNDAHKKLTVRCEEVGKVGNYTFLWTQSVKDNKSIKDVTLRKEYKEMAKYFVAIRKSLKIKGGKIIETK